MANMPAVLSFSFSISHIFFFFWLALTGVLKSDAVISGQWYIFFCQKFRTSFVVCEAARVWPGNKSIHFKNNTTQNLKLEELVSWLEETCKIPEIGFGRGQCYIHYHVLQIQTKDNFFFHLIQIEICPRSKTT